MMVVVLCYSTTLRLTPVTGIRSVHAYNSKQIQARALHAAGQGLHTLCCVGTPDGFTCCAMRSSVVAILYSSHHLWKRLTQRLVQRLVQWRRPVSRQSSGSGGEAPEHVSTSAMRQRQPTDRTLLQRAPPAAVQGCCSAGVDHYLHVLLPRRPQHTGWWVTSALRQRTVSLLNMIVR